MLQLSHPDLSVSNLPCMNKNNQVGTASSLCDDEKETLCASPSDNNFKKFIMNLSTASLKDCVIDKKRRILKPDDWQQHEQQKCEVSTTAFGRTFIPVTNEELNRDDYSVMSSISLDEGEKAIFTPDCNRDYFINIISCSYEKEHDSRMPSPFFILEKELFASIPDTAGIAPMKRSYDSIEATLMKISSQGNTNSLSHSLKQNNEISTENNVQLSSYSFQNTITPSVRSNLPDITLTDRDVLLGRGYRATMHPGNERFRKLVDAHKPLYLKQGNSRNGKNNVSIQVMEAVFAYGGRFLRAVKDKDDCQITSYVEIDRKKARKKCSQRLREVLSK